MSTGRLFDPTKFELDNDIVLAESSNKPSVSSVKSSSMSDQFLIDLSEPSEGLDYTLEINGIATFPKGDLQAIKAKAKQGKTHTILCLMTALLRGEFLTIKSKIEEPVICYILTEESRDSASMLAKKVHELCDWDTTKSDENFRVYSLRKEPVEMRVKCLEDCIKTQRPDLVFIDGVRDLLHDFNSINESEKLVSLLMRLATEYHCAIVTVLHTNKSYSDSNMRGHLGTELLNKCSDVLDVEKKEGIFLVRETDCRNVGTGEWAFTIDETGLLQPADTTQIQSKTELRMEKMKQDFTTIFVDGRIRTFTELRTEYMAISKFKQDAANRHIGEACDKNIIQKTGDGKYKLCCCT